MKLAGRFFKVWLLLLAALLLTGVGRVQRELNRQRADTALGLTRIEPLENAPPVLAFTTVALGGFRGLIANALWMRATDLQDRGQYFEMVQLADWITKLEPTFASVWIVQAWNMAYNISVKFSDPADRWRWVRRGIELLRDEGLRYNPREAPLYRELAWFFQHKMGQNLDDAHPYYKAAWAREMTELFGGPRPNFAELLQPGNDEARQRVLTLRQKYKLDPERMKEVDERYGPLEWRLPESHAIYWASLGLEKARSKEPELIGLRRVIYQSMALAMLRGRIVLIEPDGRLQTSPDLTKVDQANSAYERMIEEDEEKRDAIRRAHRNFLKEVVYILYAHNRLGEANRWLQRLRQQYPEALPPDLTVEDYALQRIREGLPDMTQDRVKAVLEGMIVQYYYHLAIDEDDRAEGFERMARQLWVYYEDRIATRHDPLRFPPLDEMKRTIRDQLLDPQAGLPPDLTARLRTKLGLPPPAPPAAPPASR